MIRNHLKFAWRNIFRNKKTSLINLVGLTIAMTASLFIFLWVKNELSYNNYHPNADHIYRIKNHLSTQGGTSIWILEMSPYILGEVIKDELPEALLVTRVNPSSAIVKVNDELFDEDRVASVDEYWFDMFHYDFVRGGAAAFNSGIYHVILTESYAKKFFGNADPIGKTLHINEKDHIVQGVLKDYPSNSSFRYNLFIPQSVKVTSPNTAESDSEWRLHNHLTFVQILPSASASSVAKKIENIVTSYRKDTNNKVSLLPIKEMHFEDDVERSRIAHGDKKTVQIFMILGVLLLIIACINYVNLTTAKALQRIKEISVKKIVGASRTSLFLQFVVESALISLLTISLALTLAKSLLPAFNNLTENQFELSLASANLWSLIGITLLISVLLTSIYPALLLSSFRPLSIFRGTNVLQVKDSYLRKALVILQFTVSIALITSTIIVYSQMRFIANENSAYDKSQILSFQVPAETSLHSGEDVPPIKHNPLKQELLTHTSISKVSMVNGPVLNMYNYSSGFFDWEGRPDDFHPEIMLCHVDNDFNEIFNLQIQEGRWFSPLNSADANNVILNETAVKDLGLRDPVIGQRFIDRRDTLEGGVIIGVVKDFYYRSVHEKIGPMVIHNKTNQALNFLVQTTPGKNMEAKQIVERIWKSNFPNNPFNYKFLDDAFDELYRTDRRSTTLIWLFAIITITISSMGLYGLATFSTERRTKEIGVRKVLGASVSGIVALLSKDFVKLVLIAILIAYPIAWWAMNTWLEGFAYRIDIQWWMFGLAGFVAVVIALFTVATQAIRAAMANPVDSLRDE